MVIHDSGVTPQNTARVRIGAGIGHSAPTLTATDAGYCYRYRYAFPWVGTGRLMDFFQVDGKTVRVDVPFDDHHNVPRPADLTRGDW